MKSGLAKEEMRTKLPTEMDIKLFQPLLNELIQSKIVVMEKDKLRLASHQIASADEKGLMKRAGEAVRAGDLQPPSSKELADQWSTSEQEVQAILEHLVHEGLLVKVKGGMYFHRDSIERLKESLIQYLKEHREITTPEFKEMTGVSRKYAIPLIEFFDQSRLTLRLGDKRVLRTVSQGPSSLLG
jgi:selenocysteine-specific elongation factor